MSNKNLTVINLFGGPGVGKSTIAANLFSYYKTNTYSCELVTEYVKDLVWDNSNFLIENQLYVFAHQYHRLHRLVNKVDIAIFDSSLLTSCIYNKNIKGSSNFNNLVFELYNSFTNINLFLTRSTKYDTTGRYQNEEDAVKLDNLIYKFITKENLPHHCINCNIDTTTLIKTIGI